MLKHPIIALDMDGVLVDQTEEHLTTLNNVYRSTYTYGTRLTSMPEEHANYLKFLWDTTVYTSLDPGVDALLMGLRELGRVVVCSGPAAPSIQSKYECLLRYFKSEDIILTVDKSLLRADILVDDNPANLEAFWAYGIIFDRPWNTGYPGRRARSLEELGPIITDHLFAEGYIDINNF